MSGPTHVTCPRCGGDGGQVSVSSYRFLVGDDGYVDAMEYRPRFERRPCSLCRGTGKASLLEPLGRGTPVVES